MVEDWNIVLSVLESPDNSLIGQQKVFTSSPINIGRSDENEFVVNDLTVSRHHATIRITNDYSRVFIIDQSTHGTFVSDRQVPKGLGAGFTIRDGETIKVGDTVLKFELNLKQSVQSTFVGKMDRSFLDNPPPAKEKIEKEEVVETPIASAKEPAEKKSFNPVYIGVIIVCILILIYLIFFQ